MGRRRNGDSSGTSLSLPCRFSSTFSVTVASSVPGPTPSRESRDGEIGEDAGEDAGRGRLRRQVCVKQATSVGSLESPVPVGRRSAAQGGEPLLHKWSWRAGALLGRGKAGGDGEKSFELLSPPGVRHTCAAHPHRLGRRCLLDGLTAKALEGGELHVAKTAEDADERDQVEARLRPGQLLEERLAS